MSFATVIAVISMPSRCTEQTLKNHDLLCIFHAVDVSRVTRLISNSLENDELTIGKNFCISEFSQTISPKYGDNDILLIKYEYGKLGCEELEEQLKNNLEFSLDELSIVYDRIKFTRKKPPL